MDETNVADVQSQAQDAPIAPQESAAPDAAVKNTSQVDEPLLPQSKVDKIVGTRVKEAYEKAKRDALVEYQKSSGSQQPAQTSQSSMGGMQQMTPEQLEQAIMKVASQMSARSVAEKMAQDFEGKIEVRKKADPEFAKKYEALNIENHPELVMWTNGLDNTAEVIADISENPTKMAQILMLAKSGFPHLAQQELTKLSTSIKANEEAKKQPSANEPLDHLKPSNVGTKDDASMTVTEFRKIFKR